jgi:hypothetical protein
MMGPEITIVLLGALGAAVVFVVSVLFFAFRDRDVISKKVKINHSRDRTTESGRHRSADGLAHVFARSSRSNLLLPTVLALLVVFVLVAALLKEFDVAKLVAKWVVEMKSF